MIKEIPIKVVKEVLICDCGDEMIWNGVTLMSYPPQYVHECSCGKKEATFGHSYPNIAFREEKI